MRRTADGHRVDGRALRHGLPVGPQGGDHRVVLRGLHHLGVLVGHLLDRLARVVDHLPGQRVPRRQPVRQQRLRQAEPGVGRGGREDGHVEPAGGRVGVDALDADDRLVVHRPQRVPGAARAPADERHRDHDQQQGQADEQQGGDERGPGLAGHEAPVLTSVPRRGLGLVGLRQPDPGRGPGGEALLLPDRHLGLERVDQVRAGRQGRAAVHRPDSDDDGEVADLEVTHPVLDRQRNHVVLGGGLLGAAGQRGLGARVLGVVERDHGRPGVVVADHTDEEGDPADRRVLHQAEQPVHAERSLGDAGRADRGGHGLNPSPQRPHAPGLVGSELHLGGRRRARSQAVQIGPEHRRTLAAFCPERSTLKGRTVEETRLLGQERHRWRRTGSRTRPTTSRRNPSPSRTGWAGPAGRRARARPRDPAATSRPTRSRPCSPPWPAAT